MSFKSNKKGIKIKYATKFKMYEIVDILPSAKDFSPLNTFLQASFNDKRKYYMAFLES